MIFKKYKKQLILSSLGILLPVFIGLLLWNKLPDSFATHWGVEGQANGWSGKAFGVFGMPLILVVMNFLCAWITDLDNRKREQNQKVINLMFWILPMISLFCNGIMYSIALGKTWAVSDATGIMLGLMLVIIGNYMPKCKQNTTIGVKVVWALTNEENWNATHRFAGKTWFFGGLIVLFCVLLPGKYGMPLMFATILITTFGSVLYSYLYYRKQLKEGTAVPVSKIPVDKTTKVIYKVVWIFMLVLLVGVACILFTGSIEYDFQEEKLVMDATYYSPITLRYENIENVEYRDGDVEGIRSNGFGSWKLLLGFFESEEFGMYSRYTYYKNEACVVVTAKGKTIVFSGKDAAETQELYNTLLSKIEG